MITTKSYPKPFLTNAFFSALFSLIMLLISGNSFATAFVGMYEDVFTTEIYDQRSVHSKLSSDISKEYYAERMTTDLYNRKKASIRRTVILRYQNKLEQLNNSLDTSVGHNVSSHFYKDIVGLGRSALESIPVVGGIFGWFTDKAVEADDDYRSMTKSQAANMQKEIRELENQIHVLEIGIRDESIAKEEEQYVVKKREMSVELQEVIEDALIQSRKRGGMAMFNLRDFIGEALLLPTGHKKILVNPDDSQDLNLRHLLHKFDEDQFFRNLNQTLQYQLKSILTELFYASLSDDLTEASLKHFYYFYGEPGIGKSESARRLMNLAGLPYYEAYVRVESDLSQENLEGSVYYRPNSTIGWLIRPFMEKDTEGKTSQNAGLIINDFDRVLLDGGPRAKAALGFLLDYLDPTKKSFYSPYFKSNIDISRMSIFITANKPIPVDGDGINDQYAALISRLEILQFQPPSSAVLEDILLKHSKDVFRLYNIEDNRRLKNRFVKEVIEGVNNASIRDAKSKLQAIVSEYKVRQVLQAGEYSLNNFLPSVRPKFNCIIL